MTRRVAIFGASGHVGGTLVERLLERGNYDVRPIINTAGNAWRLARRGIRLWQANLAMPDQIREAIAGCDIVVNCAYPSGDQMESTVRNLTSACLAARVKRFIHLSSIAVYGEFPSKAAEHETAPDRAPNATYGYYKHRQDLIVEKAARQGLASIVLCPPNITGLNSRYVLEILDAFRRGTLPLVDDGKWPCALVDAVNLAAAIEFAFDRGTGDGQRIFINDDEPTTWRDVATALGPIIGDAPPIASITAEEARNVVANQREGYTIAQAARRVAGLVELKRIVKQTPTLLRWARRCKAWSRYGPRRLRAIFEPGGRVSSATPNSPPLSRLVAHQLRGINHRCDKARQELGYQPELTFEQSMSRFRAWYEAYTGYNSEAWPLLNELYRRTEQSTAK